MLYQGSGRWLRYREHRVLPPIYNSSNVTLLNQVFAATQNYLPYPQFGAMNETSNFGHLTYHHGLDCPAVETPVASAHFTRQLYLATWAEARDPAEFYNWNLTKGPTTNDTLWFISNVSA